MAIYTPFNGAPKASGTVSINAASIDAQTLSKQTFSISNIRLTDIPVVSFPDWLFYDHPLERPDFRIWNSRTNLLQLPRYGRGEPGRPEDALRDFVTSHAAPGV